MIDKNQKNSSKMQNYTTFTIDPPDRKYLVWKCEITHPSMRPNGLKQTQGCGRWNVRMTKNDPRGAIGKAGEIQAQCKCKRKKRLSRNNVNLYEFDNKHDAIWKADLLNDMEEE